MRHLTLWLRLAVVVAGLVCVMPVLTLAAEDNDNRDHQEQMMRPMPGRGGCPMHGRGHCFLKCLAVVIAIIHVTLACWVFTDIRKRGEGHGVFVFLALLGGIPATILYALIRIGDRKT